MKYRLMCILVLVLVALVMPAVAQEEQTACDAGSPIPGHYLTKVARIVNTIPPQTDFGVDENFLWRQAGVTLREGQRILLAGNPEGTAALLVEDEIQISTPTGHWEHDFRAPEGSDTHRPLPPQDVTEYLRIGHNLFSVKLFNRAGSRVASSALYMIVLDSCAPVAVPTNAALIEQYALRTPEWKVTPATATPYYPTSTPTGTVMDAVVSATATPVPSQVVKLVATPTATTAATLSAPPAVSKCHAEQETYLTRLIPVAYGTDTPRSDVVVTKVLSIQAGEQISVGGNVAGLTAPQQGGLQVSFHPSGAELSLDDVLTTQDMSDELIAGVENRIEFHIEQIEFGEALWLRVFSPCSQPLISSATKTPTALSVVDSSTARGPILSPGTPIVTLPNSMVQSSTPISDTASTTQDDNVAALSGLRLFTTLFGFVLIGIVLAFVGVYWLSQRIDIEEEFHAFVQRLRDRF